MEKKIELLYLFITNIFLCWTEGLYVAYTYWGTSRQCGFHSYGAHSQLFTFYS